ncbi:hypothetical protein PM082_023238 [Marasmius tenuissimus]|nr:hypothetical protein PM082_023238 [Marasmius tenuissimus]
MTKTNCSPSVESYTSSEIRAINEIDPPLTMQQSATPSTTPRKRHIQPTDRASPTIRRLADERKQTHEPPQPTSNAQPHLGPPGLQTAVSSSSTSTRSHDSARSPGLPALAATTAPTHLWVAHPPPPPPGKSTSPGPLGYGQPPLTSPTPFGFSAPNSAYGYQYAFPTAIPPPSRPTSTSGHPTHPPPQPLFSHAHLTVPANSNHGLIVNVASTPTPNPSTAATAPPASNVVLKEDAPASGQGASDADVDAASGSTSEPLATAPPASNTEREGGNSPANGQSVSGVDGPTSKPDCEVISSDDDSVSGDDEHPPVGPRVPSKAGGRPSQKKIDAADELCQKVIAYLARKCAEGDVEQTLVWDRLCGRIVKLKSAPHDWNEYQSYAADPEHKPKELSRLSGTDLAWDGVSNPTSSQLKEAWRLFKEEHGVEEAKAMMGVWLMMKGIVTVQTQGERKRDFVGVQKQVIDLINWVYNRFNIHVWAILAGGLNRSDQTFSSLCELNASKGFSKVLGVEPNEVGPLYQAFICFQNALKVSNQQFAAMGATRGLKVTGPGIDEEPLVGSLPTTLLPPPRTDVASPKKPKKEDVQAIFKARLDECLATLSRSFTMSSKLPWSTLAVECVDVGVQVINYPCNTLYPWQDPSDCPDAAEGSATATVRSSTVKSTKSNAAKSNGRRPTNRGIKVLPPGDQARLIEACRSDNDHQLTLALADPIRLETGDLPVFVTVPDSDGNVIKTIAKDIPGCLAAVNVLRHNRERKVKFEEVDLGVPPDSNTGNRPTLARAAKKKKADYGDRRGDPESEGSDLTDIETPRPKKKAGTISRFPTPETIPETPSPTKRKGPTGSALKTTSERTSSLNVPKKVPTKNTITAAEFDDGDFQPVSLKNLKRGPEPEPHDGPVSKKLKETEQIDHPTTLGLDAAQGSTSIEQPHLPPQLTFNSQVEHPDGDRPSALPTAAAPPLPHLQPPFQWQAQGPHVYSTSYPYQPAMHGPPHPNPPPPHLPLPAQPSSIPMQAPYPQFGGAAPANVSPELVNMVYNTLMSQFFQNGPSGYQSPSSGPGNQ